MDLTCHREESVDKGEQCSEWNEAEKKARSEAEERFGSSSPDTLSAYPGVRRLLRTCGGEYVQERRTWSAGDDDERRAPFSNRAGGRSERTSGCPSTRLIHTPQLTLSGRQQSVRDDRVAASELLLWC